jgi:2-methylisocitrate lyase-like PEP mutase family enzyme/acyl carrier protein
VAGRPAIDGLRASIEELLVLRFGRVEEDLLHSGLVDSLKAIDVAVDLEAKLGVPLQSLKIHDMVTVTSLTTAVQTVLDGAGGGTMQSSCLRGSINGGAEQFRALLSRPGPITLPGCYDVLSAMLLEQAGFEAVFASGYGIAASMLGNPDIGLTNLLETTVTARNISMRVGIPVVVDADNGYGVEDNVARTVQELEHAGAAAITLEDQVIPKRCGHTASKQVVPLPVYMRKLETALKTRRTPMVIIARTDELNLDAAIKRGQAFHSAGADVILVDGLQSMDALKRVAAEVPGLKQVNLIHGGKTPLLSVDELHALGYKVVLYSTPALFLVTRALQEGLPRLRRAGNLQSVSDASCRFDDLQSFLTTRYESLSSFPAKGDSDSTITSLAELHGALAEGSHANVA